MLDYDDLRDLVDEMGGVYHRDGYDVLPFNHWKKDDLWMVLVLPPSNLPAFLPVRSLTSKDAALEALEFYHYIKETDE